MNNNESIEMNGRRLRFLQAREKDPGSPRDYLPKKDALPESKRGKLIQVRPGTWIVRGDDDFRMPKDIRNDFRDRYAGCGMGCKFVGWRGIGIEEAHNLSKGYPKYAAPIKEEFERFNAKMKELIRRIEYLGHKYEVKIDAYLFTLRQCSDVDIFDGLTSEMILRDINLFNSKYPNQ